ncbi:DUF2264 domain-containing protein [Paractinoplanes rishiriensis]|uniref:DUF2264 domain-containing protein n=1 Tax=Paractinoplanes rishiriensis TaxID=1050105 RepID=A0A919JTS9_9ACTN|nr:DUF2264 domain-containing protein [Actinoplanes rishiriensis]GIE93257.1 hypothetical protein Ari01nite_07220 [Actinoplanes rishiriensis]
MTDESPYTGYRRADWERTADEMLRAVRPYARADHALIDLPGAAGAYGRDSDGLEGFARTFLLAAIRLRGSGGADPDGVAEWYADGLRAGPDAWPRPDRLDQAKVEAAGIALGLHLSRPWLWDRFDDRDRERLADWLGAVVGKPFPPINWVWFQLVVEAFLREVGGPWSADDVASGLAVHESLYRTGGWYSDGPERAYDHYNGWALQMYPLLWAGMAGDMCPAGLVPVWRERLARFLDDAVHLVGADGAPLLQGRSLIYRFAAAAPFWVGAITGATNLSPGLTRRACSGMLRYFREHGAPDERGLLNLGWHREWPAMKQSYSGPGSPYWASKGMLGLLLPEGHPVWTATEEPLPVERGDFVRSIIAPGWQLSGVRADGVVRVINHGTDHAVEGDQRTDSPLYARLGYSTATFPTSHDNSVSLIRDGVRSERAGFTGGVRPAEPEYSEAEFSDARGGISAARGGISEARSGAGIGGAVGLSRGRVRWVTPGPAEADHGSGRSGTVVEGPMLTVASVVRGAVEVRIAVVEEPAADTVLEFAGWPTTGLTSLVVPLTGFDHPITSEEHTSSPLADDVRVPLLRTAGPPQARRIYAAAVVLAGGSLPAFPEVRDQPAPPENAVHPDPDSRPAPGPATAHRLPETVIVEWPDGERSRVDLAAPLGAAETAHDSSRGPAGRSC